MDEVACSKGMLWPALFANNLDYWSISGGLDNLWWSKLTNKVWNEDEDVLARVSLRFCNMAMC